MAKNFVDYVLDLETSGKRGWHSIREKWNPPRITQVGLIRINPATGKSYKPIIGGGPGQGWTNVIGKLVDDHHIVSELNIPDGFWRELSIYDPSVTVRGSVLNDQVRAHIREYLALKKTGQTGEMKSATDYINTIRTSIQKDIDAGNAVRLHTYNKGFDIQQIKNELSRAGEKERRSFIGWLDQHVAAGRIELKGVEENIHRGMYEVMMADQKVMPRFASSKYFDAARVAGLETVGLEATTPHHALREMLNDIKAVQGGKPVDAALKGLPADIQSKFSTIKNYDDFVKFTDWLKSDPESYQLLQGHYRQKVTAKHGALMAKHVGLSFEYVSGWRQDIISELLGHPKVHHHALKDTISSWKIERAMSNPAEAQKIARAIMTDPELMLKEVQLKYGRFLEESASAVTRKEAGALAQIAHRSRLPVPSAVASRLARSPLTLPILAAAGGLIVADQLIKNATPVPTIQSIREQVEGRMEGLRKAVSQWDQFSGARPSRMRFGNVSDFGSGRWDQNWGNGGFRETEERLPRHRMEIPNQVMAAAYGPSHEEIFNKMLDLSEYIYELEDADTLLMRRAWLNSDAPIVGPAVGLLQKHLMNLAKTFTGQDFGFELRVADVDAPEVAHYDKDWNEVPAQPYAEESISLMSRLMGGNAWERILGGRATHIQLRAGDNYGRYVGVPYARGKNIAGELVRAGGAIATTSGWNPASFMPQQTLAYSSGAGMWQYPEYGGIIAAQRRGLEPVMYQLQRGAPMGRSLQTEATHSLMTYAANPQLHGVRDQYAQNMYVRGF